VVIIEEDDEAILIHYGILRKSGRYPWGSGGDIPQRSRTFLDTIDQHKRDGWTDKQICEAYSDPADPKNRMKPTDLRAMRTIAKAEWKAAQIAQAQTLKERGWSPKAISERMQIPESTVRSYLKPGADDNLSKIYATRDMLKHEVDSKGLIDVGKGNENRLGISKERKDVAIAMLKEEGYVVEYVLEPQVGTGKNTTRMVLAPPGTTYSHIYNNRGDIKVILQKSDDHGETWTGMKPPLRIDPKRVDINYAETGGASLDGVIYLRPGVKDLSMRGKNYAQVRIQVGDNHYIKGMAVYKDDLPKGTDIVFNTNKTKAKVPNKLDVLKALKDDPENPFGTVVDQIKDDNDHVTSALNLVYEQGQWKDWSNTIASQVLSKQSPTLAKQQLNMTMERRLNEHDEISALTNPTVRKRLLEDFADSTDSASVHLAAAALPRQNWHVILPVDSLKDNEVFAPNYRPGEEVALIRYPHGGTFEIPHLKVTDKNQEARKMIGTAAEDAIGINSKVAARLSGADFDGDTVLVIPLKTAALKITPALKELEGFDPVTAYPKYPGMKVITDKRKQQEMGNISNLITDMTLKNASHAKIARAVKHSMVIIDAEKKELNYKQSAIDNGIRQLKEEYQGSARSGASTIISRAKSPIRVPERIERRAREGGPIDPNTGKKMYTPTNASYVNKDGKVVYRTTKSTKLAETDDAHTLSSGLPMERIYADHSNRLKALANQSRVEASRIPRSDWSPTAKKAYASEVASLDHKLDLAKRNAPLERRAQSVANANFRTRKEANPNMDKDKEKELKYQLLEKARINVGAHKNRIEFTQSEWDAVQAGAISDSKLSEMLDHANMKTVRELATPRTRLLMTSARTTRAKSMLALGYTRSQVADQLGVSISTLDNSLSGS
jgi:hypothetical protein